MKTILIIAIFLATIIPLKAQMFDRMIGLRMGYTNGIFYETQIDDIDSYRFMYSSRDKGRSLTAMKITRSYKTRQLPDHFSLYYGFGGHVGYVKWNEKITDLDHGLYWEQRSSPIVGLDAIIGISYDLTRQPISFTLDVKPFFDLLGPNGFKPMPYDFAFGVVYCF